MSKRSRKSPKKSAAPQGAAAPVFRPVPTQPVEEPTAPAPNTAAAPVEIAPPAAVAESETAQPCCDTNELKWCLGVAIAAVFLFAVMAMAHSPASGKSSLQKLSAGAGPISAHGSPLQNSSKK